MEGDEQEKKAEEVPKAEALKVVEKGEKQISPEQKDALYRKWFMDQHTTHVVTRTENPDSLELGTQKDGRIKVYGDFSKKAEFAAKVKDAIDITEAGKKAMQAAGLLPADNGKAE